MTPKPGGPHAPGQRNAIGGVPSARELPACGPGGVRRIGGVSSLWALAWNRRTCRLDTDGQSKGARSAPWWSRGRTASGEHRERQSTDARHRGGTTRSSDEGPVMGLERRGRAGQIEVVVNSVEEEPPQRSKQKVKSFEISKRLVFGAWEKIRANGGAPGVDGVSIGRFAERERDNLYRLWNRLSSGSYFPGPVRAVEIPKDHGAGVRVL